MAESCPICIEKFTKTTRLNCVCPYCNFSVCRACLQQYLLSSSEDPHCMSCKKKWNREMFDSLVSKTFRNNPYKEKRETLLFEREKALLPASQAEAARVKRLRELTIKRKELYEALKNLDFELIGLNMTRTIGVSHERRIFTIHCPIETCRGFVGADSWKCGTCDTKTCNRCFVVKEEGHECNPDTLETAQMLRRETRPCPSCASLIFKISGCDQMWCTQCHTAFSWTTGRIETNNVHNPHFYEWQRVSGARAREAGDVPCGGLPDIYSIRRAVVAFGKRMETDILEPMKLIYDIHRVVAHIQNVEMPANRVNADSNLPLRVSFLLNEIDEETMKIKLQRKEKLNNKKREVYDVQQMYVFTMVDMFRNLVAGCAGDFKTVMEISGWLGEVEKLKSFANEQLEKIGKRYNNKMELI